MFCYVQLGSSCDPTRDLLSFPRQITGCSPGGEVVVSVIVGEHSGTCCMSPYETLPDQRSVVAWVNP